MRLPRTKAKPKKADLSAYPGRLPEGACNVDIGAMVIVGKTLRNREKNGLLACLPVKYTAAEQHHGQQERETRQQYIGRDGERVNVRFRLHQEAKRRARGLGYALPRAHTYLGGLLECTLLDRS